VWVMLGLLEMLSGKVPLVSQRRRAKLPSFWPGKLGKSSYARKGVP
jgi:hypothetical protein